MKKLFFLFFVSFLFGNKDIQFVDGLVAIVEDRIILRSDLAQMVNMTAIQNKIDPNQNPGLFVKLQNNVISSMVDQKILLKMAELDSVDVEESEVDKSLEQQVQMLINQAGGEKKAEEALGQSLSDFKREFWFDMKDRLVSEKYQQQLIGSVLVTRSDVLSFYDTYRDSLPSVPMKTKIRNLLVPITANQKSKDNIIILLNSLKEKIEKGEPFEIVAKQYSIDPGSKNNGGSLGWVQKGSLVKSFEVVAFSSDVGVIKGPIETEFGYHLIETLEKKGNKIRVRHILLSPEITKKDEEKAYNFALSLQKDSIKTIDDFKNFVFLYSSDKNTKKIGGDLGWIDPSSYSIPEIGQSLKYINIGECSPPINSSFGFHLLWVEGVKKGGRVNLKDHWFELESLTLNKKKMDYYKEWIVKAKKDIYIKTFN